MDRTLDDFERWEASRKSGWRALQRALPWIAGALLVLLLAYFIYTQLTGARGVKVEAPPAIAIEMLPPPPPPPPPPEPEPEPPEPTEQPDPVPSPEPPTPTPQQAPAAAPMTIAGPPQAGSDSYGLAAGSGGGIGSPGSRGTCLGINCGVGTGGGGGMSDAVYSRYLSSVLQERVQRDEKANRQVFSADFAITVTAAGRLSGIRLVRSSGKDDRDAVLRDILERVGGLRAPPQSMRFPQRITVRGRRAL